MAAAADQIESSIDAVRDAGRQNLAGGEPGVAGFGGGQKTGKIIGRQFHIAIQHCQPIAAALLDAAIHGRGETGIPPHGDYAYSPLAGEFRARHR